MTAEMWKRLVLVTVFISSLGKVVGQDVHMSCPESFQDKKDNIITLKINNKDAVKNAQCYQNVTKVVFSLKRVGNVASSTQCTAAYACDASDTVTPPSSKDPRCTCKKDDAGNPVFQLHFFANKTRDEKAMFSYQMCAFPKNPYEEVIDESCKSVSFEQLSTEAKDQSSSTTSTSNDSTNETGSTSCGTACIAGSVVGSAAAVALIIVAIIIYKRRSGSSEGEENMQPKKNGDLEGGSMMKTEGPEGPPVDDEEKTKMLNNLPV